MQRQRSNERIVFRILAGYIPCAVLRQDGSRLDLLLDKLTIDQIAYLEEIKQSAIKESYMHGLLGQEELSELLIVNGLWSSENEANIKQLEDHLADAKISLYLSFGHPDHRLKHEQTISVIRNKLNEFNESKHRFSHLTAESYGTFIQFVHRIAMSIKYRDKRKFFPYKKFLKQNKYSLDFIIDTVNKNALTPNDYRLLATEEPWRSMWSTSKNKLFEEPLTEEQRILCMWSRMYDNAIESYDYPGEDILKHNDALDGWFLHQGKEREKEAKKKFAENLTSNKKIQESPEVFMMATPEGAKKIYELNDAVGKMFVKERLLAVPEEGEIKEGDIPAVRQKQAMLARQQMAERLRNRRK